MLKRFPLFLIPTLLLAQPAVNGRWFVVADFFGTPINFTMELKQEGAKLTGEFGGDKLEGTLNGDSIHWVAKDENGGTEELTGTIQAGAMSGSIVFVNSDDKEHPAKHQFTATPVPVRR